MASQLTDEYRRTSFEISQAIAPGWERWRARFEAAVEPVREWMISELAAQPGNTVLELAAGAGDTGFHVARALGDDARLISTDFSPAMVDVGRRRAAELGIGNVEFRVMDAEQSTLDTDSVDGVLCRFGYMLMADPSTALSETRRVLRPGGRLALAVWDAPDRNPFFTIIVSTLVKGAHVSPPRPTDPNPFSMANPDHTKALLQAAGFRTIKMAKTPVEFRFRDVDDYLNFMADTAGPLAIILRELSEQDRQTVASTIWRRWRATRRPSSWEGQAGPGRCRTRPRSAPRSAATWCPHQRAGIRSRWPGAGGRQSRVGAGAGSGIAMSRRPLSGRPASRRWPSGRLAARAPPGRWSAAGNAPSR